jgi:hypothetical protein
MDYDRLALFLSICTTPGFRRSLRFSPHATLSKCGFHPAEVALLAGTLASMRDTHEGERISFAFQKIDISVKKDSGFQDDWVSP